MEGLTAVAKTVRLSGTYNGEVAISIGGDEMYFALVFAKGLL